MIRAVLRDVRSGKATVLLGLGAENMDRLAAGEPVKVNLRHLDPTTNGMTDLPDIDIVIAFDDGGLGIALLDQKASRGVEVRDGVGYLADGSAHLVVGYAAGEMGTL